MYLSNNNTITVNNQVHVYSLSIQIYHCHECKVYINIFQVVMVEGVSLFNICMFAYSFNKMERSKIAFLFFMISIQNSCTALSRNVLNK